MAICLRRKIDSSILVDKNASHDDWRIQVKHSVLTLLEVGAMNEVSTKHVSPVL